MSKRISLITAALCIGLIGTGASAAESDGFKASYNAVSKQVTVMGSGNGGFMGTVDLIILNGEQTTADIGESVRPIDYRMIYSDANGNFKTVIPLSENLKGGKYTVWAAINGDKKHDSIIVVNDDESKNMLDSLNRAASEGEVLTILKSAPELFGINADTSAEGFEIAAKRIFKGRGNGYGSASEVQQPAAEAIVYAKLRAAKTVSEFENLMKYNESVLAIGYEEFQAYSSGVKQELMKQMQAYSYAGEKFSDLYTELSAVAKVCGAGTWSEMKTAALDNAALFGMDISGSSEYNKVLNKDRVFEIMFKKKPQTKADIQTKFNESVQEALKEQASGKPSSQPGGGGGGGGNSGTGGFAGIQTPQPESTPNPTEKTFTDIDGHWAQEDILNLSKKGIINGFDDQTFRPQNQATRAEFVTMIVRAFNLTSDNKDNVYRDVADSDWFADTIGTATALGIVNGNEGNFNPNESITRQDAAVIIERVLKNTGNLSDGEYVFNDDSSISDYAVDAVRHLGGIGIMQGDGGRFRPTDSITRAEIARLIANCLNKIG